MHSTNKFMFNKIKALAREEQIILDRGGSCYGLNVWVEKRIEELIEELEALHETVQAVVEANKLRHVAAIALDKVPSHKTESSALHLSLETTTTFWETIDDLTQALEKEDEYF